MTPRRLTPEQRAQAVARFTAGERADALAVEYGVVPKTVYHWAQAARRWALLPRPDGTHKASAGEGPEHCACGRPARKPNGAAVASRGMCQRCYKRWQRHGDPTVTLPTGHPPAGLACLAGCGEQQVGGGYCVAHQPPQRAALTCRRPGCYTTAWRAGWCYRHHPDRTCATR